MKIHVFQHRQQRNGVTKLKQVETVYGYITTSKIEDSYPGWRCRNVSFIGNEAHVYLEHGQVYLQIDIDNVYKKLEHV